MVGLLFAVVGILFFQLPAAAVAPLGAAQPIAPPGCLRASVSAGPDGVLRGVAQCRMDPDSPTFDLRYVVRTASGAWQTRAVLGDLYPMATAQDATGTYVLHGANNPAGTYVLKVGRDGRVGSRRYVGPGGDVGSVVARDGRWWAVWAGRVSGGERLYEAGTLLGSATARPITAGPNDRRPDLALRPGGGLVLTWARLTLRDGNFSSDVRLATRTGTSWQSRSLSLEPGSLHPRITSSSRFTYMTWQRNGRPVIASNESGVMRARVLTDGPCAAGTRIGVSGSTVFLAWNSCVGPNTPSEVYLAERRGGAWSRTTAFTGTGYGVANLAPYGGKVTITADRQAGDPARFQAFSRSQR